MNKSQILSRAIELLRDSQDREWQEDVQQFLNDYDAQGRPEASAEYARQHEEYLRTQSRMTPRSRV